MARERREAAYRVEIEAAIDQVKQCRSDEWFRALMHQEVLRKVGSHAGPRITDDDGNVLCPGPRDAATHDGVPPSLHSVRRMRAWTR